MTPQPQQQFSFVQKFGLKYYTFMLNIIIFILFYQLTHSTQIILLMLLIIPNLGILLPPDNTPTTAFSKQINSFPYHMFAPASYVILSYYMLYYVWINFDQISHSYQSFLSGIVALVFTISQSIDGCHELIHRNQMYLKIIGFLGLIPFQFTTYPIEHLYMHHKYVGTEKDAITAEKNMTLCASYKQTFKYSKMFFLLCMGLNLGYLSIIYLCAMNQYNNDYYLVINKLTFYVIFAYISLFVMQSVEYIEHYGLLYRKDNKDVPVLQISSWNTSINPIYNWTTFRFQRHSDHHMNAYKIYSTLELTQKMPQYPFTFIQAVGACWLSNLWYKFINPLVDQVLKGQKLKKNDMEKAKNFVRGVSAVLFVGLWWGNKWGNCIKCDEGLNDFVK